MSGWTLWLTVIPKLCIMLLLSYNKSMINLFKILCSLFIETSSCYWSKCLIFRFWYSARWIDDFTMNLDCLVSMVCEYKLKWVTSIYSISEHCLSLSCVFHRLLLVCSLIALSFCLYNHLLRWHKSKITIVIHFYLMWFNNFHHG